MNCTQTCTAKGGEEEEGDEKEEAEEEDKEDEMENKVETTSGKEKSSEKPRIIEHSDKSDIDNDDCCPYENETGVLKEKEAGKDLPEDTIAEKVSFGNGQNADPIERLLSEEEEKKLQKQVRIIFFILNIMGFLASFSYWMQSGVLPYLTRKLGVYSEVFGYMQSTYAFYQMIGSPIFGRCGDVFGCRCVMVVSELSAMLTYGMLSFASNVFMLFLSRVPALSQHNLQGSYMIITDISLPNERAKMLGILGVSHGLGMIVGSSVGGVLAEAIGEELTPLVAASGNLIGAILILAFIPSDTKTIRRQISNINENISCTETVSMATLIGLKEIITVLNVPNIKYLLFVKITSAFPFTLVYAFFSMAVMDYFHFGPKVNGIILAYVGVLVIVIQGGLIGVVTKRWRDPVIIKYCMFINTMAFLFLVVAENIYMLCVVFLPLVAGGTISHIVIAAAITKIVPIEDTGSALGLTLALHALIRIVAPTIGGIIFNHIGWPFFGVFGYSMSFLVSLYILLLGNENY